VPGRFPSWDKEGKTARSGVVTWLKEQDAYNEKLQIVRIRIARMKGY